MRLAIRTLLPAAAALMFVTACMHIDYKGEMLPATNKVEIFTDKAKITQPFKVIGNAMASGPYDKYTLDEMKKALKEKAMESGADAVLITSHEVIPDDQVRRDQFYSSTVGKSVNDDSSDDISRIRQDFDKNYGQYGQSDKKSEVRTYKRVIKAEFLKYIK